MKSIRAYKTSDGVVHEDLHRATRHADERYGAALTAMANRLVHLDLKYKAVLDFIDDEAVLEEFCRIRALKADCLIENESGDEE